VRVSSVGSGPESDPARYHRRVKLRRNPLPRRNLAARESAIAGQGVETELEHKHGRYVYEIEVVSDGGVKKELKYGAKTGALISSKARTKTTMKISDRAWFGTRRAKAV
jgi:peptidase YpeB-like protein